MTNTAASFDKIQVAEQRRQSLQQQQQYCVEIAQPTRTSDFYRRVSSEEGGDSDATSTDILSVNEQQQTTGGGGGIAGNKFLCKARGLGKSHNDQTAFIEVPAEGAKHGQVLHCSNTECFNSGRRFRYCVVCKVPVAKRNFSMRHSHGVPMTFFRGKPCWTVPVTQQEFTLDNNTKQKRARELTSAPTIQEVVSQQKRKKLDTYEEKWMSLFDSRPALTDTNAMADWMKSVIDISESAPRCYNS